MRTGIVLLAAVALVGCGGDDTDSERASTAAEEVGAPRELSDDELDDATTVSTPDAEDCGTIEVRTGAELELEAIEITCDEARERAEQAMAGELPDEWLCAASTFTCGTTDGRQFRALAP